MGYKFLTQEECDHVWELFCTKVKNNTDEKKAKCEIVGETYRSPASVGRIIRAYSAAAAGIQPDCGSSAVDGYATEYYPPCMDVEESAEEYPYGCPPQQEIWEFDEGEDTKTILQDIKELLVKLLEKWE